MKKRKELIAFSIALNAMLAMYSSSQPAKITDINTDKMYNKMLSNFKSGNSNDSNYKILEKVLNKKNKELKDLYLQGEYIVKPEFLEWQIFATGFYSERNNGDNTSGNGRYKSGTGGYYDENGNFISDTSGMKPYQKPQQPKTIDLGMSIPLKGISRPEFDIQINASAEKPSVASIQGGITLDTLKTPNLSLISFNPKSPTINPVDLTAVNILIPALVTYENGSADTLLGLNVNVGNGVYSLSTVAGQPGAAPGNLYKDNAIVEYGSYGGIPGDYSSSTGSEMIVDIAQRRAVTLDSNEEVSFTSNGKITLKSEETAGLEVQTHTQRVLLIAINNGIIEGTGNKQVAMIFTPEQTGDGTYALENRKDIILNGSQSTGIALNGRTGESWKLRALNSGNITLKGTKSFGIALPTDSNTQAGTVILNDTAGVITVNGAESGGMVIQSALESSVLNKGTININSDKSFGIYSQISNEMKNSGTINLNSTDESIGLRSAGGFLSNDTAGKINITGGNNNIGIYASAGKTENNGTITISGGTENIGAMLSGTSTSGKNTGKMSVSGTGSRGAVVINGASFVNTNEFKVSGENSYGYIAKGGTITGGTVDINITGEESVGIYAGGGTTASTISLTSGNVNLDNGGINFNAGESGTLNLNGTRFVSGNKSLGFYTTGSGKINITNVEGTIKGETSSSDRGTAFYVSGNGVGTTNIASAADLESLLSASGMTVNNLTLNMESGSRLFSLADSSLNLSAVEGIASTGFTAMTVNGNDYKVILLHKGLLNIDKEVNLDDLDSDYYKIETANSSETNNSIIYGTENGQTAMAQMNAPALPSSTVTLLNNGTINLSGQESIGIYTDNGVIQNNGNIETSGTDSYGIYAVNGTEVNTTATSLIKSTTNGAGIVLQSYVVDPITGPITTSGYGNGTFKLDHNGKIEMTGTKAFGIYADNNDPGGAPSVSNRIVNLNSGSVIDLSGTTEKGTGVYANRATVNTAGDIKVSSNGIGIYAKDSILNITDGVMELAGTGSTGIVLDGTSALNVTAGTINIKGNDNTVFAIGGTSTTTGIENIQLNIDPGLKLTLANVKNNNFSYNGIINEPGKDSVLIYGENAEIGFGTNAKITSTAENVAGLVAVGQKAVNKGELSLTGEQSTGIYTDGATAENENKIILGTKGIGIYNKDAVINNRSGEIQIGDSGVGLFGTDSTGIINNAVIGSTENSVIGIYSEGDITGTSVNNDTTGTINLAGNNVIGILAVGTSVKNITNGGTINIGNSTDTSNPSIGIYSNTAGNNITNNSAITVGENSLAVFSNQGNVTENGTLTIGNSGTGIYAAGGNVNISSSSVINLGDNEAAAVYATDNAVVKNKSSNITIGNKSFGFVLKSGSGLENKGSVTLGDNTVFVYGGGAGSIKSASTAAINATGSNNIVFYAVNGGNIENESIITANAGTGNIGIYNNGGSIENKAAISVGNSELAYSAGMVDYENSRYAVGVYSENSEVVNRGNISIGENAVGVYVKDNLITARNYGTITAGSVSDPKKGAIGIFADSGAGIENFGNITLYGEGVIGIAGRNAGKIVNHAVITVSGEDSMGIYGTLNTVVENKGTINVSGDGGIGISAPEGKIINEGTINFTNGAIAAKTQDGYAIPELINAGLINVNGYFSNEGMTISIKPNIDTLRASNTPGVEFELNSGSISASSMNITDTVKILPDFSQGTNAKVYKLEDVFMTSNGTITSSNGKIPVMSKSLTWEATPKVNDNGNIDIYMQKIDYHKFTDGLWFDDFGKALDNKYANATGNGAKIFDKLDLLEDEGDFRHVMESLAGNIYSNMNQREDDIAKAFEGSLNLLQNSKNNTKENVKVNIIGGKGRTSEDTDGVTDYDYTTTGVLALGEVEKTYRHTFGYSLGYLHTGFELKDGNQSEEWADTVQLGVHNKYSANDWKVVNNLTGRVSFHNVDRNIEWPSSIGGKSEMNGTYETYSVTSDNILGKEFAFGKKASLTPYGGFRAMYVTRPDFSESGDEALEVKGNDAWSAKPRVGVELKGVVPLGSDSGWQLKGSLDVAYEYELADLNEREDARLIYVEDNYHKLSKPEDEKGTLRTKASVGVEVEDRYGIFINGEYGVGEDSRDDYRVGVTLKAVF